MINMEHQRVYRELLQFARRITRHRSDAEDLLQQVLLAAIEAGRADFSRLSNRRWLHGALRKRALFDARTAARRRKREHDVAICSQLAPPATQEFPDHFVKSLPKALRTTVSLALTGHNRLEIRWLLGLSDTALRQRIAQAKRRWRLYEDSNISEFTGLDDRSRYGQIRASLIQSTRRHDTTLGSHDPDGHLFLVGSANNRIHIPAASTRKSDE